jgi:hypothetical protein
VAALAEARRVSRIGGVVAAAAISRYASLIGGTASGDLDDPRFVEIVERDLQEGQHRNPENVEGWFTTAYFHLPEELCSEVERAGLTVERLAGVNPSRCSACRAHPRHQRSHAVPCATLNGT